MSAPRASHPGAQPVVAAEPPSPVLGDRPGGPGHEATAADFDVRVAALAPLYAAAGRTLTWGFRTSLALLGAGLLLSLVRDEPISTEAEPLPQVISLVRDGRGAGLLDLGLIAMVLTPVATVLVLAVGFVRLGDRVYALITLVVLAILGASVALALLR